ncbi:universal stress protein [Streptomyces sp. NBC_01455]|uniref:universal stress protein n=1 Tax=Streptomyces sp. NBC_01455 TaxID=2903874 RepID=UPI002E3759B2|nr:universal stress protein [Streptomyces sp. NBC_01455]
MGNRGNGGFTEALLSSVTQHMVQRAPCPVVVLRTSATHRLRHGNQHRRGPNSPHTRTRAPHHGQA